MAVAVKNAPETRTSSPFDRLAVASLAGSILLVARFSIRGVWWLDFGVFRLAGQLPVAEIYSNTPPAPPFIYPPTSLLLFRLLGRLPFNVDLAMWLAVCCWRTKPCMKDVLLPRSLPDNARPSTPAPFRRWSTRSLRLRGVG